MEKSQIWFTNDSASSACTCWNFTAGAFQPYLGSRDSRKKNPPREQDLEWHLEGEMACEADAHHVMGRSYQFEDCQ